jgi:hypothetical protein
MRAAAVVARLALSRGDVVVRVAVVISPLVAPALVAPLLRLELLRCPGHDLLELPAIEPDPSTLGAGVDHYPFPLSFVEYCIFTARTLHGRLLGF